MWIMVGIESVILAVVLVISAHAQMTVDHPDIPDEVKECLLAPAGSGHHGYNVNNTERYLDCMQMFLWKADIVDWSLYNITKEKMAYTKSLMSSVLAHGRVKRQAGPPTGFRWRREYRRLTDFERQRVHLAFNRMKNDPPGPMGMTYDDFANMHTGMVIMSAHGGPNFLGWHRIYITLLEEEMRRRVPGVTLPYWDSSLDFHMSDPTLSIIWSPEFLGNGFGVVNDGPFAFWSTISGVLRRNINGGSRLISRDRIAAVMSRCRTAEIVPPMADAQFDLELMHGGPHTWVGGQFGAAGSAAFDPIFFMHHAFIDYLWEVFRVRQASICRINPVTDYPPVGGRHARFRRMDALPRYRNIDGYAFIWTAAWFNYERSPSCSMARPFCGTPYLRCDRSRGLCISVERAEAPRMLAASAAAGFGGSPGGAGMAFAARSRAEASTAGVGPAFRSPPADPRTQDGQAMSRGRGKRSTRHAVSHSAANSLDTPHIQDNVHDLVAIPVTVFYEKPDIVRVFNVSGGYMEVSTSADSIDKRSPFVSSATCYSNMSRVTEIKLTATGLNYFGHRSEILYIDSSHSRASVVADLWVGAPTKQGATEVALSAEDGCGRMCVSVCSVPQTKPVLYEPCTGVISVTSTLPLRYTIHDVKAKPHQDKGDNFQNKRLLGFRCGFDLSANI